jgi:hypothetical protein
LENPGNVLTWSLFIAEYYYDRRAQQERNKIFRSNVFKRPVGSPLTQRFSLDPQVVDFVL